MATLYILCGPSGSGKSTWADNTRKMIFVMFRVTLFAYLLLKMKKIISHMKKKFFVNLLVLLLIH